MSRKFVDPRKQFPPAGDATRAISPFNVRPGDRFVLSCRCSNRERQSKPEDQEPGLRQAVEEAGGKVIKVVYETRSGFDPSWLYQTAQFARRNQAIILAESTDRLVRSIQYHSSKCPNAQPTDYELDDLIEWTLGVPLMTLLHPNATPSEVRSFQSRRGQSARKRKGGRPKRRMPGDCKRQWKAEYMRHRSKVRQLNAAGTSLGKIGKAIGKPKATVQNYKRRLYSEHDPDAVAVLRLIVMPVG